MKHEKIIDIALLICFLCLAIRLHILKNNYTRTTHQTNFSMVEAGVPYAIWHKDKPQSILHIGDLLGTNLNSVKYLEQFAPPENARSIIIPSIHPVSIQKTSMESLIKTVTVPNGIVLADNFCFPGWDSVKSHDWYKTSPLSPGSFCFSEPQTRLVDRLIKQYHVQNVKIYADNKIYTRFIETFLRYLDNNHIHYEIILTSL